VLNEVLRQVLHPLTFKQNPGAERRYYNVLCADANIRRYKPGLAAWLADCPEYSDLHNLEQHACFWCECTNHELGDYVPPDKQPPRRNYNLYRMLSDTNTKAANAKLFSRHVYQGFNLF